MAAKRGRPKVKDRIIQKSVGMNDAQWSKAKKAAEFLGLSIGDVIRNCISDYMFDYVSAELYKRSNDAKLKIERLNKDYFNPS